MCLPAWPNFSVGLFSPGVPSGGEGIGEGLEGRRAPREAWSTPPGTARDMEPGVKMTEWLKALVQGK